MMPQDTFSFDTNLVDWNGLKDQFLKRGSSKGGLEGSLRISSRRWQVWIPKLLVSEVLGNGCRGRNRGFEVVEVSRNTDLTAADSSGRRGCKFDSKGLQSLLLVNVNSICESIFKLLDKYVIVDKGIVKTIQRSCQRIKFVVVVIKIFHVRKDKG